ncbi:FadR/GntR family transcriptional regulator [Phytoactinopolyspora halotolerans]|uniref:FadR family transcriptional regulator n=1 Tax=Phytoactinopolyspora halotolerans TaxID=1981512 RepID=A0A6L9SI68_9ACTN|nr:FCD domain-containing protein [Phytoactinopolyspora halotolerans]NEE04368.1 FadR family transcriptional regulator [Phytoactinopolyspora halotolerans]
MSSASGQSASGQRPLTAVERACAAMVQMLDLGEFQPGERLPSADAIAKLLGVSRPIALQTLRVLEGWGRVHVRRGSGAWVAPLSVSNADVRRARVWRDRAEILQMSAMREMLEVGVAHRLATVGLAEEGAAKARWLIEQMLLERTREACRPLDKEFHDLLARSVDLPIVADTLRTARARTAEAFEFVEWPENRVQASQVEHRRLLDAIVARDPEEASRAAREHVGVAGRLLEELLGGDGTGVLRSSLPHQATDPDGAVLLDPASATADGATRGPSSES